MPPKTRKIALTNQLEDRYSTDVHLIANNMSRDPEALKQMQLEEDARLRYAMEQNMAVGQIADPSETNLLIDRIGPNKPQNVLINHLGSTPAQYEQLATDQRNPSLQDPRKKSMFARAGGLGGMTPLAFAIAQMFR